jgi:hypothetical protein
MRRQFRLICGNLIGVRACSESAEYLAIFQNAHRSRGHDALGRSEIDRLGAAPSTKHQVLMWLALAGVAALLNTYPAAFYAVQWLGAAYLAWPGIRASPLSPSWQRPLRC